MNGATKLHCLLDLLPASLYPGLCAPRGFRCVPPSRPPLLDRLLGWWLKPFGQRLRYTVCDQGWVWMHMASPTRGKCRSSGDGWFLLISYRVGVPVGWTCFAAVCLTDTKRSALIASLGAFLIQRIMSSASPPSMPSTLWRFLCFQWFSTCVFCGYEGIGLSSVCPLMRMPSFNIRLEWCMQCEVSRYPGRYCLSSLCSWQGCLFVCSSWGV